MRIIDPKPIRIIPREGDRGCTPPLRQRFEARRNGWTFKWRRKRKFLFYHSEPPERNFLWHRVHVERCPKFAV